MSVTESDPSPGEAGVPGTANGDSARGLQALAEISRLVMLGLDERAILQHVTEAMARLLHSPYARLWMLERQTGDLVVVATAGPLTSEAEIGLRRPASLCNLNQAVLADGRIFQTPDVAADPRWHNRAVTTEHGLRTYLGVPLLVGEHRYAIMTLLFPESRVIGPADLELVEAVAAQAAAALANARAYDRLAALSEISRLVTGNLELPALMGAAVQATSRLLGVADVTLWLYEPDEGIFRLGARVPADEVADAHELPLEGSIAGLVLRSGQPLVADSVRQHPLWLDRLPHTPRSESGLFVPLFHQERPMGVVVALSPRERAFDESDVQLLQTLGAQVAVAVQNARLYQDARRQARELATVLDVNKRLALGPQLEQILSRITEEAARLIGADGAGLRLLDGDELVRAAIYGRQPVMVRERMRVDSSLSGRVVIENRPIVIPDVLNDPRAPPDRRVQASAEGLRSWLGVPLRGRDQVLGALIVLAKHGRLFNESDVGLLEAFADQAAIAVENARLFATAERRAAEAMAMAEVGRAITGSLDLQAVLDLIVDQACRLLGTRRSALAVVESRGDESVIEFVARRGLSDSFPERMRPRHGRDGTTPTSIAERRPIWTADVLTDPQFDLTPSTRAAIEAEGYHAVLSVPLLAGSRVLGALVVYRDTVSPFTSEEVDLLRVFADQAAIAIENARAFQQEQERRLELEAVRDVTSEITRELDLSELLDLIIQRAAVLVRALLGIVYLWDEEGQVLLPRAWHGIDVWTGMVQVKLGEGVTGAAAERRMGVIANDYGTRPLANPVFRERSGIGAALAEPLLYRDRLIGVITMGREASAPGFSEQDQRLLGLFADQAAIAIQNARLFEQASTVEALRELDRLKAEFLNTVSHELRTPLSLIHGYSELLMHRASRLSSEEMAEMAAEIHAGSRTMVRLVDDLLDFSRIEQGKLQLRRRRVAITPLLTRLVETFGHQPDGARIRSEIPDNLVASVDPDRLAQVIGNLLANALRYAPDGPIVVRAGRRRESLRVEVSDRGPGIARAEQARVWEKFYRGAAAISAHRGSGLGLSIVKHLVELHGGQVGLKSAPDRGATFWFTLPMRPAAAPTDGAPHRRQMAAAR